MSSESTRFAGILSGVAKAAAAKARTPQRQSVRVPQSYAGAQPGYGNAGADAIIVRASAGPFPRSTASTDAPETVTELHTFDKDDRRLTIRDANGNPAVVALPVVSVIGLIRGIDYLGLSTRSPRIGTGTVSQVMSGGTSLSDTDSDDLDSTTD